MPCNPLPSSKDMQDPKEWDTENWEMQCKLCFQRVDQISSNGLKLQAWMFLAEPAFLRLIPAPGWNKAVSVTGISLSWFSHLNFKAHCRWHFFSFFFWQNCPRVAWRLFYRGLLTRGVLPWHSRGRGITFQGWRNPSELWSGTIPGSEADALSRAGVLWRCWFLLCLGVAVSQPWLLLYRGFFLYLLFFLFCTFIDF